MRIGNRLITTQHGFTYLGILLAVAIIGVALSATGTVWHTAQQREKELELLFVGNQYRQAIGSYYLSSIGPGKSYPQTLEDLARDPRQPGVVRHLRKLYRDPITNSNDWGLIKDTHGGIIGVYSNSDQPPHKRAQFNAANAVFEGKEKYSDWQFVYQPQLKKINRGQPNTIAETTPSTNQVTNHDPKK